MSRKKEYSVILNRNNKFGLIMKIIFANDGSIYFTFPNDNKTSIKSYINRRYSTTIYEGKKIKPYPFENENEEPKISLHPRDMIVRVNSNKSGRISENYEIYNASNDKSLLNCYLMQLTILDDVNRYQVVEPKEGDFIIQYNPFMDHISLEIIIHSKILNVYPTDLPMNKKRTFREYIEYYSKNNPYVCSVFLSTMPVINSNRFLICINSKRENIIYELGIDNYDN